MTVLTFGAGTAVAGRPAAPASGDGRILSSGRDAGPRLRRALPHKFVLHQVGPRQPLLRLLTEQALGGSKSFSIWNLLMWRQLISDLSLPV